MVSNNLETIWNTFAKKGFFSSTQNNIQNEVGLYGAAATFVTLQPGETLTLPLVFSWFFPFKNYLDTIEGN
jgi:hypothetical protein